MSIIDSIKPFWPFLLTFILPRLYSQYQQLRTAYRTRPSPKPLPPKTSRSLNILFATVLLFLLTSLLPTSQPYLSNIFATTSTRLHVPTSLLFSRLSTLYPDATLPSNPRIALLEKLFLARPSRALYLRYGPDTLLDCPFCSIDEPLTYALYHVPTHILLPHLLHLAAIGLATSSICGPVASGFRTSFTVTALALLGLDVSVATVWSPSISLTQPAPWSLFVVLRTTRPLVLCAFSAMCAGLIWVRATGRFLYFPLLADPSHATSPDVLHQQAQQTLSQTGLALQTAQQRLRAFNIARNTVVRDEGLKGVDDGYWRRVVEVEGLGIEELKDVGEEVWDDEEVQAAVARVFGGGKVDVVTAKREASAFVEGVTRGLERQG